MFKIIGCCWCYEITDYLIINNFDLFEVASIQFAIALNYIEVVRALAAKGADVNVASSKAMPPLHFALNSNFVEVARLLINDYEADVNQCFTDQNNVATSVLFHAVCSGNMEMINIVINKGTNYTQNIIHIGVQAHDNRKAVVEYMIEKLNINIEVRNEVDSTPLHCASDAGYMGMVKFLVEKGVDVNAVSFLILNGASVGLVDVNGMIPLHYACKNGHDDVLQILIKTMIENKMDFNVDDINNKAPMDYAVENENNVIVNMFNILIILI